MFRLRFHDRVTGMTQSRLIASWIRGYFCICSCDEKGVRRPISRVLSTSCDAERPFLWDVRYRTPRATNPGDRAGTPPRPSPPFGRDAAGHPYSVLLPVGFTLPPLSPGTRCALTAPFHPYLSSRASNLAFSAIQAVYFLWHCPWGRPRRPLAGTVFPWSPDFPPPPPATTPAEAAAVQPPDASGLHAGSGGVKRGWQWLGNRSIMGDPSAEHHERSVSVSYVSGIGRCSNGKVSKAKSIPSRPFPLSQRRHCFWNDNVQQDVSGVNKVKCHDRTISQAVGFPNGTHAPWSWECHCGFRPPCSNTMAESAQQKAPCSKSALSLDLVPSSVDPRHLVRRAGDELGRHPA